MTGWSATLLNLSHPPILVRETDGQVLSMPRGTSNAGKVRELMRFLGREATGPGRVYLVGGASAVIIGWRSTTVDVDLKLAPEPPGVFGAIARAKDALDINVELAAPDDFIPALPEWSARSVFVVRHGPVDFLHYDFYAQTLAKIERGHEQDLRDVQAMRQLRLIEMGRLLQLFDAIEPDLERYPAIDPAHFRDRVRSVAEERRAIQR